MVSRCELARGPDADRHVKLLIQFALERSHSGAYSQIGKGGDKLIPEFLSPEEQKDHGKEPMCSRPAPAGRQSGPD